MFCGLTRGVNIKRLTLTIVAVLATFMVTNFLIHCCLLRHAYEQTSSLWRNQPLPLWMILAQAIMAKYFCLIFAKGYEGTGVGEGLRFGFLFGGLGVGQALMQYGVMPVPWTLGAAWMVCNMLQGILAGVVASLVYKK